MNWIFRRRLAKSAGSAIGFMPDDSQGTKEIFRIENFEMVPLEEDKYGLFFGGDSYVIKYSYELEGRPAYIGTAAVNPILIMGIFPFHNGVV